jgi:hypothetical protein
MTDTTLRSCYSSAFLPKVYVRTYSLVADDEDVLAPVVDLLIS